MKYPVKNWGKSFFFFNKIFLEQERVHNKASFHKHQGCHQKKTDGNIMIENAPEKICWASVCVGAE